MPLSGVNEYCMTCEKKCKQWEQVIVCFCPNFKKLEKGTRHTKIRAKSTQGKNEIKRFETR